MCVYPVLQIMNHVRMYSSHAQKHKKFGNVATRGKGRSSILFGAWLKYYRKELE